MTSEYECTIRRTLWTIAGFSVAAMAVLLFPFIDSLRPASEHFETWFQRTGAPMTIFALIAQSRVTRLSELLTPNTFSTEEFNGILLRYRKYVFVGNTISLFLVMVGTLIWAYGDIFWREIHP